MKPRDQHGVVDARLNVCEIGGLRVAGTVRSEFCSDDGGTARHMSYQFSETCVARFCA